MRAPKFDLTDLNISSTPYNAAAVSIDSNTAPVVNDFRNEEAIWKVKSNELNYALKRTPALQVFYKSLSKNSRKEFFHRCRHSIHQMASKLRSQALQSKSNMDAAHMFTPEVNAHRAENAYLSALYAQITCESVEDPVLEAMAGNSMRRKSRYLTRAEIFEASESAKRSALKKGEENFAMTEASSVYKSSTERKPRLPSFESFLQTAPDLSKKSSTLSKTTSSMLYKTFVKANARGSSRPEHQLDSASVASMESTRKLRLRETPFGRALAARTSRVAFKVIEETQQFEKAVGACILDGRTKGAKGRGYYNGFRHVFEEMKGSAEEDGTVPLRSDVPDEANSAVEGSRAKGGLLITCDDDKDDALTSGGDSSLTPQLSRQRVSARNSIHSRSSAFGLDGANQLKDNQSRLVLVWDTLKVSAVARLQFMQKYTSPAHVSSFLRALELWASVTLLFVLRRENLNILQLHANPLHNEQPPSETQFIAAIEKALPSTLVTGVRSAAEVSSSAKQKEATTPPQLMREFKRMATGAFAVAIMLRSDRAQLNLDEEAMMAPSVEKRDTFFVHALTSITRQLERKLMGLIKLTAEELGDELPYGGSSLKEWLQANRLPETNTRRRSM